METGGDLHQDRTNVLVISMDKSEAELCTCELQMHV